MSEFSLGKKALAEFIGTAALLCTVIGSGIMAERLSGGNVAIALLANTLATMFALYVLIETLEPVSGAHFNPLVTLWALFFDRKEHQNQLLAQIDKRDFAIYLIAICLIVAQLAGAACGAWLSHVMFDLPILQTSAKLRGGWGQWIAESVATAGLLFVIIRSGAAGVNAKASALVASYIGAAYWFTASTSFANPAAVFGRMLSNSFAGIAPASVLGFVGAQCVGAAAGAWLASYFKLSRSVV
jgi:glycerol uptake facilitator-like aquaporin